jgi:RNA polymerase sigma factor FliA
MTETSTDTLWRQWRREGDLEARRLLLGRYLGLVHHAAREVAPRVRDAVSLDDLVSAGSLGLLQAMEGFDTERGLAFSTFAMRRIRGAILDELRARDPLSRSDRASVRRMEQAIAELEQRLGRAPHTLEVAASLGVDHETVSRLRERTAAAGPVSLDGVPGGRQLAECIGGDEDVATHDQLDAQDRAGLIHAALVALPSREAYVLRRSYLEEVPLRAIASELGVTESRVCQLRNQGLARLRRDAALALARE